MGDKLNELLEKQEDENDAVDAPIVPYEVAEEELERKPPQLLQTPLEAVLQKINDQAQKYREDFMKVANLEVEDWKKQAKIASAREKIDLIKKSINEVLGA